MNWVEWFEAYWGVIALLSLFGGLNGMTARYMFMYPRGAGDKMMGYFALGLAMGSFALILSIILWG